MKSKIKPIAIYLPQFHPTPENDFWWGKGFTEWTNVTKSVPVFKNHVQPNLPTDLGFYDLRLQESRLKQEALAKEHGIFGFCIYHYWFNGKRLLHEPLDRKLKSPDEDLPFMLCWANETWSRRWLGEEAEILIKQEYSLEDDINHINWLINVFKDKRYIKINNRPVFVFYRPTHIPRIKSTIEIFRKIAKENGLENPYLIGSNSHSYNKDLIALGFDDVLNFQPKLGELPLGFDEKFHFSKALRNLKYGSLNPFLKIYEYEEGKTLMDKRPNSKYFPCSLVGWDNTPRRGSKGIMLVNRSTQVFKKFLQKDKEALLSQNRPDEENFLFINAWNEWAEGNFLEPSTTYGSGYLETIKELFSNES